ncbi:MAG: DegT/DnrJ/EryC1/StrS family aminotransferase [Schleiferiaceae bacterium]|nr:DegT/DnrJ/EryC1/StrS family aminotransferase [Schleiferiaceae bacterium]
MKPIQMVDLVSQYHKIKDEVDEALQGVMNSAAFINGPEVQSFKKELAEYLNVKHVIPCANGTDALQIAMMALGLKPGDEVIAPTFTFVATAEVIALLGLTPVLVDVDPDTMVIDPKAIRNAITPKTKAIVPVHLFGQCANMVEIQKIAKEHGLVVIEDTAQAIGADHTMEDGSVRKAGTIGEVGCTSFFPSKNLGCFGDGGAIFTNDDDLADRIAMIVNHGMKVRYYHDEIGVNSRLDSMQAAVLRIKLRRLDEYNANRRAAAQAYSEAFASREDVQTPVHAEYSSHVYHQYTLRIKGKDRNALQKHLMDKGIPAMIYYPVPMHLQSAYQDPRYKKGDFEIGEMLMNEVISLPMHSELTEEQINHITSSVLEFLNQ